MSQKKSQDRLKELVSKSPLFKGLQKKTINQLLQKLETQKIVSGETLFEENAEGKALYIIVSGRVSIHVTIVKKGIPQQRIVGYLGRGEVVGEMSLITGEPRSATLKAVRDTSLLRLTRADFETLFMEDPLAMKRLMAILVKRLKETTHATAPTKKATAFMLYPFEKNDIFQDFLKSFTDLFAQQKSIRLINRQEALQALNIKKIIPNCGLSSWLSDQEEKVDVIFYLADETDALWTDICTRQSDSILYVGQGSVTPPEMPLDLPSDVPRELVLLHSDPASLPIKTKEWIDRLPSCRCHHLRPHDPGDIARLVRILTGGAIGVVMGGGGARGFAHIGALKAFDEIGIPIDMIGGTSMGALVSASRALGWSTSKTTEIFREFFLESGGLQEYTVPVFSLIRGQKIKEALTKLVSQTAIEDLWLPYFCVSTDLTNAEKVLHKQGPLLEGLLSSFAIPGVLPPVLKEGHILVDGAFLDNLPIKTMRETCPGSVIALNVSPLEDASVQTTCQNLPAPTRTLFDKLNPFSTKEIPPGIISILMRATTIGSVHQLESLKQEVDLFIEPPISHFSLMDWEKIDDIIETGYRETLQKLTVWQTEQS